MENKYDIFISYRREGGLDTANLVFDRLTRAGYRVFMDYETLRSGKFNEQLYQRIEECIDFIVVLGKDALDRCVSEDDWLRLEIAHALKLKKNIIPVMLRNFEFSGNLPEDIRELSQYQGIEASPALLDAFMKKLQSLLHSKKNFNLPRLKKQLTYSLIPTFLVATVLSYFSWTNHQKKADDFRQYEQACTEVVSFMGLEFVKVNGYISEMNDVYREWIDFRAKLAASPSGGKDKIKKDFVNYLDFRVKQIDDTEQRMKTVSWHEDVLLKNGFKTEDIKVFFSMDQTETPKEYIATVKRWATTPESGWLTKLDEAIRIKTELSKEMIVGEIYSFIELIIAMPPSVQQTFLKIKPSLGNFPDVGLQRSQEELRALEDQSQQKCNELLNQYSSLVGDENKLVDKMQSDLDAKKAMIAQQQADMTKKISDKMNVVTKKAELVDMKKNELSDLQKQVRETYARLKKKTDFDKNENPDLMWGKVVLLAKYGIKAIENEKKNEQEYERLKKEAGKNAGLVTPLKLAVPSAEILHDVQLLLDKYLVYNKERDKNAGQYVSAAKQFYNAVFSGKLQPHGVLMMTTKDNEIHPFFKVGDIVVEKKGKSITNVDEYFKLNSDPAPNVQKVIRFASGGKINIVNEQVQASKVLVGFVNLCE